jgi:hypothetical protein
MKTNTIAIYCITAILLWGCASVGTPIARQNIPHIKKGVTTEADLTRMFGAPFDKTIDSNGKIVIKMDKEIAAQKPHDPFVETDVVSKETEQINTQLLDLLIEELSDDADLQKIIECNIDGIFKRAEIATRLGKTVSDITNMKKRLDRRLPEFTAKYADRNPYLEERK